MSKVRALLVLSFSIVRSNWTLIIGLRRGKIIAAYQHFLIVIMAQARD